MADTAMEIPNAATGTARRRAVQALFGALFLATSAGYFAALRLGDTDLLTLLAQVITRYDSLLTDVIFLAFLMLGALTGGVFLHYLWADLGDRSLGLGKDGPTPGSVLGRTLRQVARNGRDDVEERERIGRGLLIGELGRMRRNLTYLSLTSVIAPALGFLGTAIGMVSAFYAISLSEQVSATDLASSIQIALITTVVGLSLKACAMLCKAYVIRRLDQCEDRLIDALRVRVAKVA